MYKKISLFAGEIVVSDLDIFDEGFLPGCHYEEQRSWKKLHCIISKQEDVEKSVKSIVYQWNVMIGSTSEKIKKIAYTEQQRILQFSSIDHDKEKELIEYTKNKIMEMKP